MFSGCVDCDEPLSESPKTGGDLVNMVLLIWRVMFGRSLCVGSDVTGKSGSWSESGRFTRCWKSYWVNGRGVLLLLLLLSVPLPGLLPRVGVRLAFLRARETALIFFLPCL